MPIWKKDASSTVRIGILLFDRFSNHCFANALEPFRAANAFLGRDAYEWHVMTPGDLAAMSSSGFPVMPTTAITDMPGGDILFVIASYGYLDHAHAGTTTLIRRASRCYDRIAALDTASWLLGQTGLLSGHRATIHRDEAEAFAERFQDVILVSERWIDDGRFLSAGGAATAFELALHEIGRAHGTALTLQIAALFFQDPHMIASDPPPGFHSGDRIVARALEAMEQAVETPVPVADIARAAGCPQRALEARFRRRIGAPPRAVYRRIRLLAARKLLSGERISIAETATRCGYTNASAFARAFRREFGDTPSESR